MLDEELASQANCKDFFFEPVDLSLEEELVSCALQEQLRKYRRLFKYIFDKYANSQNSKKQISSFDNLKQATMWMNLGELTKCLCDHDVTSAILP